MSDAYFAQHGRPKTPEVVKRNFRHFGIEGCFDKIRWFLRPAINVILSPTDDADIRMGQSKVGGRPDLPAGAEWPINGDGDPLDFIAQLNFREISPYDETGLLPKEGLASLFYSIEDFAWGYHPAHRSSFKVLYTRTPEDCVRREFYEKLNPEVAVSSNAMRFERFLSLPPREDDLIAKLIGDEYFDNYAEACNDMCMLNQILGHAAVIQNPMELKCQLVSNGVYCGDASCYEDPRYKSLEEGAADWVLLFQMDSEEEKTGVMWGDSGRLYFWIRRQDLLACDFDHVWCILQCC